MKTDNSKEIEVRFLEIDIKALLKKLRNLKAIDMGKDFIKEIIFYDKEHKWRDEWKMVRLRQTKRGILLAYKHHYDQTKASGTEEIEFSVDSFDKTKHFLEKIGLVAFRYQEKRRHTLKLDNVIIDIDTWPSIPTYVELEGTSEKELKKTAKLLGLNWRNAIFESPRTVIEKYYHIPVSTLKYFTFEKIE